MNTETNAVDASVTLPMLSGGRPATEVLVPVHGAIWDDRGAGTGSRFAARWNLPLRIVHVSTSDDDLAEANLRWAAANFAVRPTVEVVAAAGDDDVVAGIVAAANPGSLVMLGSDNAHQWVSVPSVSESLLQAFEGPIVLCGPRSGVSNPAGSVVVGLDGSPTAEGAIEPAVALARSLQSTLWLVKVVDSTTTAQVAKLRAEGQRVSESAYLRDKADLLEAEGVDVGWEILHSDDASEALADFAADRGAAMVVASSHGASGIAKRVFGSVSLGLVERSTVPVMICRTVNTEPTLTEG